MKIVHTAFAMSLFTASFLLAGGCRAIVGIHDLELDDGGVTGDANAEQDTGPSGGDAKLDAPPDGKPPGCGGNKEQCLECCRTNNAAGFATLVRPTGGPPCYCGACSAACSASACANPPEPQKANGACNACMGGALLTSGCQTVADCKSGNEPTCKLYLACAEACPK